MAALSLDELWTAYQDTLPRLDAARAEHDEAYKMSQDAYRRWIAAGGTHKTEPVVSP
jgi:hypothetical protein